MRPAFRRILWVAFAAAACLSTAFAQTPAERLAEIRVHGNVRVPDADIRTISGLDIGSPADDKDLADAKRRLEKSGKFESVEIRKRYRSIDDTSAASVILIVHERPEGEGSALTRPLRRLLAQRMFSPIFAYRDGYGLAYGVRTSTRNTFGLGERWSIPLTWGGAHSAFAEVERPFEKGPLTTLQSRFGVNSEINPHFVERDHRVGGTVTATRSFGFVRLSTENSGARVRFGSLEERLWTSGGTVTLDTRDNPAFPANAIYASGGWHAQWSGGRPVAGIALGDLRGYWRAERHVVLAARVRYEGSNRTLPDYERLLVGGTANLRGKPAGAFDGDKMLTTSAEARVLLASPLSLAQVGATLFFDAAKAFNAGQSPSAVPWSQSAGIGFFSVATIFKFNVHAAKPLDGGPIRIHTSFGFTF